MSLSKHWGTEDQISAKYQPDKRITKFYTITGCLIRHEFGLGSYDTLVYFSATQMQTLQAKKRDDMVSNRSNSYKTKTAAERTTLRPSYSKMHEKEPV